MKPQSAKSRAAGIANLAVNSGVSISAISKQTINNACKEIDRQNWVQVRDNLHAFLGWVRAQFELGVDKIPLTNFGCFSIKCSNRRGKITWTIKFKPASAWKRSLNEKLRDKEVKRRHVTCTVAEGKTFDVDARNALAPYARLRGDRGGVRSAP